MCFSGGMYMSNYEYMYMNMKKSFNMFMGMYLCTYMILYILV
jgi:hypothetical protein